jgi:hypothetical protein
MPYVEGQSPKISDSTIAYTEGAVRGENLTASRIKSPASLSNLFNLFFFIPLLFSGTFFLIFFEVFDCFFGRYSFA